MDGEICVTHVPPSRKILWTWKMEHKYLELLQEQVHLGRKGEGGFRKDAWIAIERKFNTELNLHLSKDNFKNKLKTWKLAYRVMKEFKNTSGFTWNEATHESVWDDLLKVICYFKFL